jgi:hypothetical protein
MGDIVHNPLVSRSSAGITLTGFDSLALLNRHGEIVVAHYARIVTYRGRIERETR